MAGKLSDQIDITQKSKRQKRAISHHKQTMDLAKPGANDDTVTRLRSRHVSPKLIKLFPYRDRNTKVEDESKYQDLIDGLKKEGDQINPAIVRTTDDPDFPYELIVGQRRMNACIKNGIRLLVLVKDITDKEAAKMVNDENDRREDTTPFEKALHAYSIWNSGIYEEQKELSNDFNIPQASLTERLQAASISKYPELYNLLEPSVDIVVSKAIKVALGFAKKETEEKALKYIKTNYSEGSTLAGEPNKILDDLIIFIESLSKPKQSTNKIIFETIKIDGAKATLKRDRKGKVKIELDAYPENAEQFFSKFVEKASKLL